MIGKLLPPFGGLLHRGRADTERRPTRYQRPRLMLTSFVQQEVSVVARAPLVRPAGRVPRPRVGPRVGESCLFILKCPFFRLGSRYQSELWDSRMWPRSNSHRDIEARR